MAFKQTETYPSNQGQILLNEAIEEKNIDIARKKLVQAIESFKTALANKPHCRISREGIIDSWGLLSSLYYDQLEDFFPDECINFFQESKKQTQPFSLTSMKIAIVDSILESDWKKQCNGKYGGPKLHNKSWKQFYFDNEEMLDKLDLLEKRYQWAVQKGHYQLLDVIFKQEPKLNINSTVEDSSRSLLEVSIINGYRECVDFLVDKKADINNKGTGEWTPIHWAVHQGNTEIVMMLLEKNAKINAKDKNGITPLHIATYRGFDELVLLLLKKGARVNVQEIKHGASPLHLAIYQGHYDIAETLLEHGANFKSMDEYGRTLLHWTTSHGLVDMSSLLIRKGANINAKDDLDRSPIHWASQNGHQDVLSLLIEYEAKINEKDKFGETPMIIAAFSNHTKLVRLLFEHGGR